MKRALGVLALAAPLVAHADSVVTACQRDTQTGAGVNLAAAIAAGGVIRFACPGSARILITRTHRVTVPTRVEGGGVILDGGGVRAVLFQVSGRTNLSLNNIVVRRMRLPPLGQVPPLRRASVVHSFGPVELDRVRIEESESPITGGKLTVESSFFERNSGTAIRADEAYIRRSFFRNNAAGIVVAAGELTDNALFQHTASAVYVRPVTAPLLIRDNRFSNNQADSALVLSTRGRSRVDVRANRFADNDGGQWGGALRFYDPAEIARANKQSPVIIRALERIPPATIALAYNRFERNSGQLSGAITAELLNGSTVTSVGDQFLRNRSRYGGGAIALSRGRLQIAHALFADNRAVARGGAVWAVNAGQLALVNSLVVRNAAIDGAIVGNNSRVRLHHVTLAANTAAGLVLSGAAAATSRVEHSIFSGNQGGDCVGVPAAAFQSANLQSPGGACAGVTRSDAFLDALFVPLPGSPAYGAGEGTRCQAEPVGGRDFVFQPRSGPMCTLGAFEGPPIQKANLERLRERRGAVPDDAPIMPAGALVPPGGPPNDEALRPRLRAAVDADESSPAIFMATRVESHKAADIFLVEHVRPDKWRIVRNPAGRSFSYVSIGASAWMGAGTQQWRPAPPIAQGNPFPVPFPDFADRVTDLAEVPGDASVLVGNTHWVNGAMRTEGRVAIVFASDGRIAQIRFEGLCAGESCRILQVIERPVGADIRPPATNE